MNYYKANIFNEKASNPKNRPDQILETLNLQLGQNIADIGAGGGYFSLRFAKIVGQKGQVFAVDTDSDFLEFIKCRAEENGLNNIGTILVTEDGLNLPENSLDLIFMRNVCHHLPNQLDYFIKLKSVLKLKGRVAIIEYTKDARFEFRRMFFYTTGHYVPQKIIIDQMREAGYQLNENLDFLPKQSFMIFSLCK